MVIELENEDERDRWWALYQELRVRRSDYAGDIADECDKAIEALRERWVDDEPEDEDEPEDDEGWSAEEDWPGNWPSEPGTYRVQIRSKTYTVETFATVSNVGGAMLMQVDLSHEGHGCPQTLHPEVPFCELLGWTRLEAFG